MTMTPTRPKTDAERLADARAELDAVRSQLRDETERRTIAEAALTEAGLPQALSWLQSKCDRQRVALDRLTVRQTSCRLALRRIQDLGRGLTRGEWMQARNETQHLRTEEDAPVA